MEPLPSVRTCAADWKLVSWSSISWDLAMDGSRQTGHKMHTASLLPWGPSEHESEWQSLTFSRFCSRRPVVVELQVAVRMLMEARCIFWSPRWDMVSHARRPPIAQLGVLNSHLSSGRRSRKWCVLPREFVWISTFALSRQRSLATDWSD